MARKTVIYSRYSSDLQSEKSCVDQEREIRGWLTFKGIDHKNAIVVRDEAESGTKCNRSGFEELSEMVKTNEVGILVVDDQSRLSSTDFFVVCRRKIDHVNSARIDCIRIACRESRSGFDLDPPKG